MGAGSAAISSLASRPWRTQAADPGQHRGRRRPGGPRPWWSWPTGGGLWPAGPSAPPGYIDVDL